MPVVPTAVDATAAGAVALGAVGAGLWPSTREIAERVPVGEPVKPQRDKRWREAAHEQWRDFVQKAAEL